VTIRIYPSRLPGEPLETHNHYDITINEWMIANVENYTLDKPQHVAFEVDGVLVPVNSWLEYIIKQDDDVRVYPIPGEGMSAAAIASWISAGIAAASAIYAIVMMSGMDKGGYSSSTGTGLELNPAKANTARLGDPIREVFGRMRIYPDYILQPVTRFNPEDPTKMTTEMLLCLGMGKFAFTEGDIRIGSTPISSLGEGVKYTVYPPGADVSEDRRSENWFNSTEVGGTSSGTGLDMAQTAPDVTDINAYSMTVSGVTATFNGLINSQEEGENALPENWIEGMIINIIAPANFLVTSSSGYSVLMSDALAELKPSPGMPVTLEYSGADYQLFISDFTPGKEAVPGTGGRAASLRASAAPVTYDFSRNDQTFFIEWQGRNYIISLDADYLNMSGLLVAINRGLFNSGLIASDIGGTIHISDQSPFSDGRISCSDLPVSIFGINPVFTDGIESNGGQTAVMASVKLAYDSASGTAFTGIPEGMQRLSLTHRGSEYQLIDIDGTTITVGRIIDGVLDRTWPGFVPRTIVDFSVTGINDNNAWMGPFLACPENEIIDAFEVNFSFPSGICGFNNKGKKRFRSVGWEIQYRVYGSGAGWTSYTGTYNLCNVNGLGFTEIINLESPGLVEVRCRRTNEQGSNNARDSMYWQALRGRLLTRPHSYAGVSLIGVTVETGGKLAAQSDRRVNVVLTRIYDNGKERTISGAFYHVGQSLGLQMDIAAIESLEEFYWTPRGETFDHATVDSISTLEMLQKITGAGKSYFLINKEGLASIGREGVKPWVGAITPHEMVESLQTDFIAPNDDDYDAVDVTYINGVTWAEETVHCRIPGNQPPRKIEAVRSEGILDEDRAYQFGMRRLMKHIFQRLTHKTTTEMHALCYDLGDRIILTDDIPGNNTLSCLIIDMITIGEVGGRKTIFTITENPDWTFNNPRVIIKYQDGRTSKLLEVDRVDDFKLSVDYQSDFSDIILNDPVIEPPTLIFCSSEKDVYHAIIRDISPQSDGKTEVIAIQYMDGLYQFDDEPYPGELS
jgi:hypothetical protein